MIKTRSPSPNATRPAQPATGAATGVAECDAATLAAVGDVLFQLLWILCEATAMRTPRLLRPVVLAWMRWKLKRSVRQSMRAPVSERDLEEEYEAEEILSEGGLRPAGAARARAARRSRQASGGIGQEGDSVRGQVEGGGGTSPARSAIPNIPLSHETWWGEAQSRGARGPTGGVHEKGGLSRRLPHVLFVAIS